MELNTKNAAQVVFGAVGIENVMNEIIMEYFFENKQIEKSAQFFKRNLLESSGLQVDFKKRLILRIIQEESVIDKKMQKELDKRITEIFQWRNAFAHGKFEHDISKGTIINYYSGKPKTLILTNEFWSNVTTSFSHTYNFLKSLSSKISR